MAEMCRRLETEEEKVLPFYASSLTEEEQNDVEAAIQEQPYEKLSLVRWKKNQSTEKPIVHLAGQGGGGVMRKGGCGIEEII